jgi:hypothetical protein
MIYISDIYRYICEQLLSVIIPSSTLSTAWVNATPCTSRVLASNQSILTHSPWLNGCNGLLASASPRVADHFPSLAWLSRCSRLFFPPSPGATFVQPLQPINTWLNDHVVVTWKPSLLLAAIHSSKKQYACSVEMPPQKKCSLILALSVTGHHIC